MTSPSNPPAFPFSVMTYQPDHPDSPRYTTNWHEGMTLRDYFAAAALKGIVSGADTFWAGAAPLAYEYADAMLRVRNAKA